MISIPIWLFVLILVSIIIIGIVIQVIYNVRLYARVNDFLTMHDEQLSNALDNIHMDIELANIVTEIEPFKLDKDLDTLVFKLNRMIITNKYFLEGLKKIAKDYNLVIGIPSFTDDQVSTSLRLYKRYGTDPQIEE